MLTAAFLLGLVLQFNPLSSAWGLPFMRLSDAFSIGAGALFLLYLKPNERAQASMAALPFLFITSLSLFFKAQPAQGDTYLTLMLMAHFVSTLMMLTLGWGDKRLAIYFSVGSLIGFGAALVILFLRASGLDLTSFGLGVSVAGSKVNSILATVKPGGLWVHGNEAGHVFAMAGAPALYLSFVYRRPIIYAAYYCALLASFTVTLNRGGILAPTLGLIFAYFSAGRGKSLIKFALALLGALLFLGAFSFLPLFSNVREAFDHRFLQDHDLGNNVSGRSETLWAGVRVAFSHPFGIGFVERISQMRLISRFGTPHNGFIAFAFQAGLGAAALYVASLIQLLSKRTAHRSLPVLIALFSLPSMFFEELSLNPVFLFTIALTVAEAVRQIVAAGVRRPLPALPHPINHQGEMAR